VNTTEKLVKEIEGMPEQLVAEVYDFAVFIRKQKGLEKRTDNSPWGGFALGTGAFDFWNDPQEVDYSLRDLPRGP